MKTKMKKPYRTQVTTWSLPKGLRVGDTFRVTRVKKEHKCADGWTTPPSIWIERTARPTAKKTR